MKSYKVLLNDELVEELVVNPSIDYKDKIQTIDNCLSSLNVNTNVTYVNPLGGIEVAQIGKTSICVPPPSDVAVDIQSAVYFNTFDHFVSSGALKLKSGDVAKTKGFYAPNDGGGSTYIIRTSVNTRVNGYALESLVLSKGYYVYSSPIIDGVSLIQLKDGLYAELVIEDGSFVNLRQLGGRPLEDGVLINNSDALNLALTFIQRKKFFNSIYIPSGHWCFGETIIKHKVKTGMGQSSIKIFGCNTVCMPYLDNLAYIFKVGVYVSSSVALNEARGMELSNLTFQCGTKDLSSELKSLYGSTKYVTTSAVYMENSTYSTLEHIEFKYIFNTALLVVSNYESHFNYLRFHCCGGIKNGKVYPVMQLDKSGYSYASSVSANWYNLLHFDSCLGPCIWGGALNNGHNEFNCIMVTGSSDIYNAACPDAVTTKTSDTVVGYGIIDNIQGMTNFWPNLYNTIMCTSFDNGVIRDGVQYKLRAVLYHTIKKHCHVYLGNVSIPEGKYVTYVTESAISYSVKQLFDEKAEPFYCEALYLPKHNIETTDPRLIYASINGNNPVSKYSRSNLTDNPTHLIPGGNSSADQFIFIAKAGKQYGLKLYKEAASGGYWINLGSGNSYTLGLWIYNNGWCPVGPVLSKTLLGSDKNWRYVLIENFFCFKLDTLVRVSGGAYEFFYEQKTYNNKLIDLALNTNNITNSSGGTATYTINLSSPVTKVTATLSNSDIFFATISGNTLTLTAKKENTGSKARYTNIMLTGRDANNDIVTKVSFLSVPQPIAT